MIMVKQTKSNQFVMNSWISWPHEPCDGENFKLQSKAKFVLVTKKQLSLPLSHMRQKVMNSDRAKGFPLCVTLDTGAIIKTRAHNWHTYNSISKSHYAIIVIVSSFDTLVLKYKL